MGSGLLNLLAGGLAGFAHQAEQHSLMDAKEKASQRESLLGYLSQMASNPNVPQEHQQWAMQKGLEIINTPGDKKLPKIDLGSLPAINRQTPAPQAQVTTPGMSLQAPPQPIQMPMPPPGFIGPPSPAQMGSTAPPANLPGGPGGSANPAAGPVATPPPLTLPPSTSTVMGPTPPPGLQVPAGTPHLVTPEERINAQADLLQQSLPGLSRDRAMAKVLGVGPDPLKEVGPGGTLFDPTAGKAVYTAPTAGKPGEEMRPDIKDGMLVGIVDPQNNRYYTDPSQMPPAAKKMWEDTTGQVAKKEKEGEAKQARTFAQQLQMQSNAMVNAMQMGATKDAESAAKNANKLVAQLTQQVSQDQQRYQIMQNLKVKADKGEGNIGSYDTALLAFHMGMTVGAVKGMRQGRDLILMHKQAKSLPESMQVAIEHWVNGAELSAEQRQNFTEMADEKLKSSQDAALQAKNAYKAAWGDYSDLVTKVGKGKVTMPAKPPGLTFTPEEEAAQYLQGPR